MMRQERFPNHWFGGIEHPGFKSSLRVNLHTGNQDSRIEHDALKTLAAFLNTRGGTLVIGVDDKGIPLGLENDGFQTEDKTGSVFGKFDPRQTRGASRIVSSLALCGL